MSAHDHDPEYYMKNVRGKISKESSTPVSENETAGYSDEERLGSFIKIYGMAKNMSLREFMNWCDKEDYYFIKPIKTPKLSG
jgi:hypothetical protein